MANVILPNNNTSLYNSTGNATPVDGNINANNINASGNVTVDGFIYANGSITTDSNFVGNLVGNVTGNVSGNIILGGGNTEVIFNDSGVTGSSPAFTFDKASNVVSATGNIVANYYFGNGSQLTGLPATYSNANVAAYLPVYSGNIAANVISATGNISGSYFLGNGALLTGLPATYSNANVAAYLPVYSGNLAANTISASGNVTGLNLKTSGATGNIVGANYVSANFYLGDGGLLSNIATGNYSNANVANYLPTFSGNLTAGNISATGNITGSYILGNGSQLTGIVGNYSNANVANYLPTYSGTITAGTVSATGNITGNYFFGNGSQLTGLPATYGNANVASFLANSFGSNTITTTGNITAGYFAGNGNLLSNITGANVVGNVPNATYSTLAGSASTAVSATTANTVTGNAQANITSVGTLTGLNVNGAISATGNITGNYFFGNGSQLTGIVGNYSNANVANYLPTYSGNIGTLGSSVLEVNGDQVHIHATNALSNVNGISLNTPSGGSYVVMETPKVYIAEPTGGGGTQLLVAGNINTQPGNINVSGRISASGNVTAGNVILATNAGVVYTNNVTGLPGDNVTISADGTNDIHLDADSIRIGDNNADATLVTHGTGNLILRTHEGSATEGNIIIRNGASGNIDVTTNGTGTINLNGAVSTNDGLTAAGNVVAGNISTAGLISATGNVTGNFILGNGSQLTSLPAGGSNTQIQFNDGGVFAGNANVAYDKATGNVTIGNLIVNANAITNINSFQSNANPNPGRILFGAGRAGNYNPTINTTSSRVLQVDEIIKYDDGLRSAGISATLYGNLSGGNIGGSNANTRLQATQSEMIVVSGNALNNNALTVRAHGAGLQLGASANTGNAFVQSAVAGSFFVTISTGSSANTMIGALAGATYNGNVANAVGYLAYFGGSANVTGNCYGFYMPSNVVGIGGQSQSSGARSATNYYFLRNDDTLAKSRLGSLELYHNYTANTSATTGTVNIDKNNGQWQQIYPTGNVTIGTFSNFVTRVAQPSGTQVNQTDVVTLLIQQSAAPYTITMPTGNANIRYANGVSTVANTANSTTIVTITGTYNYNVGGTQYLINISPEYT